MKLANYKFLQNKNMIILMVAPLIIHLSTYLVIPILPIVLEVEKNLNPLQISIIISANFIAAQIGSIIGGILSDKINTKITIIVGAIIQALSTFFYAFTTAYFLFIIIAVITGIGHGMNAPSIKSAINKLTIKDGDEQTSAFSFRGIAANAGLSIAGIVIIIIAKTQYDYIFYISSILYAIIVFLILFFRIKDVKTIKNKKISFKDYKSVLKDKQFINFCLVILIISIAYSQLQFILPLRFITKIKMNSLIGLIWTIISFEVIFFQTLIHNVIIKKIHPYYTLFVAMLFFSGGILFLGFANTFLMLLISALIFTVGQMLITPTIDSVVGKLATDKISGFYFSVSNLLTGLGSAIGTYASGVIINFYSIDKSIIPYLIISISLIVLAFIIILLKRLQIKLEQQQ
jgi:MFS family permease